MQKLVSIFIGLGLVLFGLLALAGNIFLPVFGIHLGWLAPWRFWPLLVLGAGTLLFVMALFSLREPGLGALFIPAVPVNMVGAILLYASLFDQWQVWRYAWSLVVLAVAVGFVLAAVFTRSIWLGIPALLVGANGVVLAFCSLTGLWHWWSVLWTVEPFTLGLVFLLISYKTHSLVMSLLGFIFCGFAALAFAVMTGFVVFGGWVLRFTIPALLIFAGVLVLSWGLIRRPMLSVGQ